MTASRQQLIDKLNVKTLSGDYRSVWIWLTHEERQILIAALRLADAAERQETVAWLHLGEVFKNKQWRSDTPLVHKLSGAADEKYVP